MGDFLRPSSSLRASSNSIPDGTGPPVTFDGQLTTAPPTPVIPPTDCSNGILFPPSFLSFPNQIRFICHEAGASDCS